MNYILVNCQSYILRVVNNEQSFIRVGGGEEEGGRGKGEGEGRGRGRGGEGKGEEKGEGRGGEGGGEGKGRERGGGRGRGELKRIGKREGPEETGIFFNV